MSEAAITAIASVITAIVGLVGTFLMAWLKAKYGTEKLDQYTRKAREIVDAAEQIGGVSNWTNDQKYQYASTLLAKLTGLDPVAARVYIEAAVHGIWVPYSPPVDPEPPAE